MSVDIRRIAINTGGGDAPGLNAVIKAAVHAAAARGWEIVGVREGYDGRLFPDRYPDGGLVTLTPSAVEHIAALGGTIPGTTNRGNPFRMAETQPDGTIREVDRTPERLKRVPLDGEGVLTARSLGIALGD